MNSSRKLEVTLYFRYFWALIGGGAIATQKAIAHRSSPCQVLFATNVVFRNNYYFRHLRHSFSLERPKPGFNNTLTGSVSSNLRASPVSRVHRIDHQKSDRKVAEKKCHPTLRETEVRVTFIYVARVSAPFLPVRPPSTQRERTRGTLSDSESPRAAPRPEVSAPGGSHRKSMFWGFEGKDNLGQNV